MSSSVARMTGPGTVPLYVQAGKKTPGAISISRSIARIVYSRTRPGWYGQRRRRIEQRVEVVRAADGGRLPPIMAACPCAAWSWTWPCSVRCAALGVAVERELPEHGRRDEWARHRPGVVGA